MPIARLLAAFAVAACLGAAAAAPAWSQAYPSRPIQLIVAYAAGGTGDIVARSVSDKLAIALGQSVVVENRAPLVAVDTVAKALPDGYSLAWSGESYQEKTSGQNTLGIFGLAVLMVFLILAAQYERITLPFAVILAVPFAVFGAFLAVWLRGIYNDLYLQIGLVTLVGLAAKNAILIVEFAAHLSREGGMPMRDAAIEAARLRFRPIVMTSLAFVLGVLPLALSTGAGAGSRHSIGTGVIGGMLAATFIAVLFIPLFFVWTSSTSEAVRRRLGVTGDSATTSQQQL